MLGLLAAGVVFGYRNVVFSQTIAFAADEFDAGAVRRWWHGTVVRWGLLTLALAALTDRLGRRILVTTALVAPLLTALCAFAPNLATLTAIQTIAAAFDRAWHHDLDRRHRGDAGRGAWPWSSSRWSTPAAAPCIIALPLADLGLDGWRLVYLVPLVLLVISVDVARRLPESRRFMRPHAVHPPLPRRRFLLVAVGGLLVNLLIAPSTFYENRYLKDVRGYSAAAITVYTLVTSTPGGIGVFLGGRMADVRSGA